MIVEIDIISGFDELSSVTRQTERLQVDCSRVAVQQ